MHLYRKEFISNTKSEETGRRDYGDNGKDGALVAQRGALACTDDMAHRGAAGRENKNPKWRSARLLQLQSGGSTEIRPLGCARNFSRPECIPRRMVRVGVVRHVAKCEMRMQRSSRMDV